ncbi:serine/threonine-protein kinase [Streptomyces sp. NPDC051109]|uniref:serine/threonine-protein kinase n=1 Tax=Streptomyces sp. NPDC051109 TaxID=3365642 RepID=UPI0037A5BE53
MTGAERAGPLAGGRYRLVSPIGSGGHGRTWQAHDELLDTRVAVKALSAPVTLSDAARGIWLRRTAQRVRRSAGLPHHPNLAAVLDVVVVGDSLWIVMELVEGQSLAARLREQGPLRVPEAVRVATALLAALQAVHDAMFVHGAVCPDNVMLVGDGVLLLSDPEAVVRIGEHGDDDPASASGLVRRLDCLAPERIQGLPQLPASDLYALGVTLYEAVEATSPFRGDSPAGLLAAILHQPPPPMRRAGPLEPLIEGLLRKDPGARPTIPQARAVLDPLAHAGPDARAQAVPGATPVPAAPAPDCWDAPVRGMPEPMSHPFPVTQSRGGSPLLATVMLLLSLVTVCVLFARPVLEYAGSLAAAAFWPAVLSWMVFALGLLVLGHQVRATARQEGWQHPVRTRLSLAPPPRWSPQEHAARREAAERAVDESLLRVDQRLAAASPRPNRNGGIDA